MDTIETQKIALENLTPKEIVKQLDTYIVGQTKAKKSVAIALRNRTRRLKLAEEIRDEIAPKNILMIVLITSPALKSTNEAFTPSIPSISSAAWDAAIRISLSAESVREIAQSP